MKIKKCSYCKQELPVDAFHKNKSTKDGLTHCCKKCISLEQKDFYLRHRDKIKRRNGVYCRRNRKKYLEYGRKHRRTIKGHLGQVFYGMHSRCNHPDHPKYKHYGGRGIENKFESLHNFREYVTGTLGFTDLEQIKGLQIDRINNNGHYEKGNIRFVTCKENNNNKGR
ncbi:hypothetical protein LCGC14_0594340 [marine sediment metagenome]|uniref:Nuclease associated modular domain-containing protein n=1 Tax=marine sediment metagenome TaxID=412755 RepID=A0A0F9RWA3_9ZZZZ